MKNNTTGQNKIVAVTIITIVTRVYDTRMASASSDWLVIACHGLSSVNDGNLVVSLVGLTGCQDFLEILVV